MTFVLGCILGGISGYYGGVIDEIIQRIIEVLMSVPSIPLWIALRRAPQRLGNDQYLFCHYVDLGCPRLDGFGACGTWQIISLREEEFALAAKAAGASDKRIIFRHLLPAFVSYLIVNITWRFPA